MKISVVIPTCSEKRLQKLKLVLTSLLRQSKKPSEILIIDACPSSRINSVIDVYAKYFKERGIKFVYRSAKGLSLTSARNVGIEMSQGDIVLFLDDDVVLFKNYIEEIVEVYRQFPDAIGVQGFIINYQCPRNKYLHIMHKIFMLNHYNTSCRILRSLTGTYPQNPNSILKCEWLVGCNHSWKRSILKMFRYDENLPGPSYGEDKDLSYRVYRARVGSLYLTPHAKVIHLTEAKDPNTLYLAIPCKAYLMLKIFKPNIHTIAVMLWHWFGHVIIRVLYFIKRRTYMEVQYVIKTLKSLIITLMNFSNVISGDLHKFRNLMR